MRFYLLFAGLVLTLSVCAGFTIQAIVPQPWGRVAGAALLLLGLGVSWVVIRECYLDKPKNKLDGS